MHTCRITWPFSIAFLVVIINVLLLLSRRILSTDPEVEFTNLLRAARTRHVGMTIDTSLRYHPSSPEGLQAWAHLLPTGRHLIRTTTRVANETHTLAMFHQLRCLDIIRHDYVSAEQSPLQKHCLNYLRQSLLCMADSRLEYGNSPERRVVHYLDTVCHDWTLVYAAAEANFHSWLVENDE